MSEDITVDVNLDDLSVEELKAQFLALKAERDKLASKPRKAAKPAAPVRTPEEQAQWEADVAAAEAELATAESAYKAAKDKVRSLKGKLSPTIRRGPSGVGAFIKKLILDEKTNEEIMAEVAAAWPDNFTNVNCINWYRNAIKKYGPTGRPLKSETPHENDESIEDLGDEE